MEVERLRQFVATTLTQHSRVQVAEWKAEHVIKEDLLCNQRRWESSSAG